MAHAGSSVSGVSAAAGVGDSFTKCLVLIIAVDGGVFASGSLKR